MNSLFQQYTIRGSLFITYSFSSKMDLSAFLQKLENHLKSSVASSETDKMNFYHLSNTVTSFLVIDFIFIV